METVGKEQRGRGEGEMNRKEEGARRNGGQEGREVKWRRGNITHSSFATAIGGEDLGISGGGVDSRV